MDGALKAVFFELRQSDELQGVGMGGFQDDGWCNTRLLRFPPAEGAQTPAIAGLEPRKAVLWQGRDQVIAPCF